MVFTETETYSQCLTSEQSKETNVRVFPDRGIGYGKFAFYDRIEEDYERELSYYTDIVNAFTGIIKAFQHRDRLYTTQIYGIPLFSSHREGRAQSVQAVELNTSLALGLAWQVDVDATVGQRPPEPHVGNIFPSWCWAACKAVDRARIPIASPSDIEDT